MDAASRRTGTKPVNKYVTLGDTEAAIAFGDERMASLIFVSLDRGLKEARDIPPENVIDLRTRGLVTGRDLYTLAPD